MKYKVLKIEEDMNFGCEERAEETPLMAVVTLEEANGNTIIRKFPDDVLLKDNIQPEDEVIINENGMICKVPREDWTRNCTPKTVDVQKFVAMMQAVEDGKEIEWVCPFCGGEVKRLEWEAGHTVIGCTACDMRIDLENH